MGFAMSNVEKTGAALAATLFLDSRQVRERYGVSRTTVWRWVREGRLPEPVNVGPASIRWRLHDLQEFEAKLERLV